MRAVGVGFVRRTVADDATDDDQRRLVVASFKVGECFGERVGIVRIFNSDRVPTQTFESTCYVFTERQIGMAFNGDAVVIVDPAEIRQLQVWAMGALEKGSSGNLPDGFGFVP